MGRAGLRLVNGAEPARRPAPVAATLAIVAVAALAATLGGADRARRTVDPRDDARAALELALERGNDAPEVVATLERLARAVRDRPLDARGRVAYAAMVLGLARTMEQVETAAFHADLAARLAPVTVPVVRSAAQILVRGTRRERAAALNREMFAYDGDAAAELLLRLEPFLTAGERASARPPTPAAALAWARALAGAGRGDEAVAVVAAALELHPDDPGLLRQRAMTLVRDRDWATLARLLPADADLPATDERADLFAARARWRCATDSDAGGVEDARASARLADSPWQRQAAGDALDACGETEAARRAWVTALHRSRGTPAAFRVDLRVRLARAEEAAGDAAAALRHWRAALELAPDHAEARAAIARLGGAR